jgi:hypothetical protein
MYLADEDLFLLTGTNEVGERCAWLADAGLTFELDDDGAPLVRWSEIEALLNTILEDALCSCDQHTKQSY